MKNHSEGAKARLPITSLKQVYIFLLIGLALILVACGGGSGAHRHPLLCGFFKRLRRRCREIDIKYDVSPIAG